MPDLLHVDDAGGRAQHGEIVGHEGHLASIDAREARHLAVGGGLVPDFFPYRPRVAAGLDEAAGVHQVADALARVQHALRFSLGELFRPAHRQRFGVFLFKLFQHISSRHCLS
ncbi:hypothetical protein D3C83_13760 [compost metagenome]